jgi:hypothetical protein
LRGYGRGGDVKISAPPDKLEVAMKSNSYLGHVGWEVVKAFGLVPEQTDLATQIFQ